MNSATTFDLYTTFAQTGAARRATFVPLLSRRAWVVAAVVGLHVVGFWGLQTGLLHRAVNMVLPVQVLVELIEPARPLVEPSPPAQSPKPVQRQPSPPKPVARPAPPPSAVPVAVVTPEPLLAAPSGIGAPAPVPASFEAPTPVAEAAAPAPAPAAAQVEQPSSSADYLNNPSPPYPAQSKRLGEQGRVLVRVRIEIDGTASAAEVATSSGFQRLDLAALQTVKHWRFAPGKRAGVAEAMWFSIPIHFVLE